MRFLCENRHSCQRKGKERKLLSVKLCSLDIDRNQLDLIMMPSVNTQRKEIIVIQAHPKSEP